MKKKKVLFLGATGRVGPGILEEYQSKYKQDYDFILGSRKKLTIKNYETVKIDFSSITSLKKAMKNIDIVLDLAAESNPSATFKEILKPNIEGTYNVFEAAKQAKVQRVIYASSVHAIRGYPLGKKISENHSPKPSGLYGASKVFGESLCYIYSNNHNLSCLAIRIGAYVSNDLRKRVCLTRDNYDYVISQRDLAQLIHKCITAPKSVKYGILSGSSNNKKLYMNLTRTKKLVNYKPQDDAYKFCKSIKN
jgi:uronate dehydrogenase